MRHSNNKYINASVLRGLLSVLGPLLYPLLTRLFPLPRTGLFALSALFAEAIPAVLAAVVTFSALGLELMPTVSRVLITLALFIFGVATFFAAGFAPAGLLAVVLAFFTLAIWIWTPKERHPINARRGLAALWPLVVEMRAASIGALLVFLMHVGAGLLSYPSCRLSLCFSFAVVAGLMARLFGQRNTLLRFPMPIALIAAVVGIGMAVGTWRWPLISTTWLLVLPLLGLVSFRVVAPSRYGRQIAWWEELFAEPYRLLFFSFLATCLGGGFLLAMPIAASSGHSVGALNALFTSVSATCVTGLIVVDTPTVFSTLGQVLILMLIQIGGLGIMTFSVAALILFGGRLSLRYEGAISAIVGSDGGGTLAAALKRVLAVTFVIEGIGTGVLALLFIGCGDAPGRALWRGLFTAISAYCNAGFALQTDNLIPYQHAPAVLHIVALLIILGGLGPMVVLSIPLLFKWRRMTLHARIVLFTTAGLLLLPGIFIAIMEWSNTLSGMTVGARIANAWFQSVTPRTAGFNSVNIAAMHPVSLTIIEGLMFVGGSPASTAGGIKTTTFAVMVLGLIATLRKEPHIVVFGWRIAHQSLYRATAIVSICVITVFIALISLQLTQPMSFDTALFEVLSAFGTVGLSIGGTALLDAPGKILIILLMFAGRIGPLSLFMLLGANTRRSSWDHPEQEIYIG